MTVDVITRPKINTFSRAYPRTNTAHPKTQHCAPRCPQTATLSVAFGRAATRFMRQEAVALWNVAARPDSKQSLPRSRRASGAEEFPLTLKQNIGYAVFVVRTLSTGRLENVVQPSQGFGSRLSVLRTRMDLSISTAATWRRRVGA